VAQREPVDLEYYALDDTTPISAAVGSPGPHARPQLLTQVATIVTPETILAWHRKLVGSHPGPELDLLSHAVPLHSQVSPPPLRKPPYSTVTARARS
jgi:hypothetical protein